MRSKSLFPAGLLCAVIFTWALFGIFTRQAGHLAAFWPANALLLGLLLRFPQLATWQGWCGALLGYFAADVITGGQPPAILLLTAANVAGVTAGYALFQRLSEDDRRLKRPQSVLYLVLITITASSVAGIVGAVADPILFGQPSFSGWIFWFVTELVNYIAILPVVLTIPDALVRSWPWHRSGNARRRSPIVTVELLGVLPALAVALSAIAGMTVSGPGAVAFPVPALLWCALTYSLFANALLALTFSGWTLLAISFGYLTVSMDVNSRDNLLSIRVGVMMIALAPLVVASVMASRNELLARLQNLATHDHLTGLLNRAGFHDSAHTLLALLRAKRLPVAVLMIDIDHFKSVNDTYGHAAGDRVLSAFARIMGENVRANDALGRIGGEEFSIVVADCPREPALALAARLCAVLEACPVELDDGRTIHATVSIGVAIAQEAPADIEAVMRAADAALYRAKEAGRNRFEAIDFAQYPAVAA